jgi:hypothetical protein
MSHTRLAVIISLFYSLPLLVWMMAQLAFIEWSPSSLQPLFRQSLFILLLLQSLIIAVLFINQRDEGWQQETLAALQILFYPLPILTLTWLTGSASLTLTLKGMFLVTLIAALANCLRHCSRLLPNQPQANTLLALAQLSIAVVVWNFRELWWNWLAS